MPTVGGDLIVERANFTSPNENKNYLPYVPCCTLRPKPHLQPRVYANNKIEQAKISRGQPNTCSRGRLILKKERSQLHIPCEKKTTKSHHPQQVCNARTHLKVQAIPSREDELVAAGYELQPAVALHHSRQVGEAPGPDVEVLIELQVLFSFTHIYI